MSPTIPDSAITSVAEYINKRHNKNHGIPVVGNPDNIETPQIFEIAPFDRIDDAPQRFYAVDGSYNSEPFYNGLSIGVYTAGYVCYQRGKPVKMSDSDDPTVLGRAYYPHNVLVTRDEHLFAIYDELLSLKPVKQLLSFWNGTPDDVFAYKKETVCRNLSSLLGFCQEVLEWAMVFEIASLPSTQSGDFILRDGTLRSLHIKQKYLVKLGEYIHEKNLFIVGVTKQSPIKMELSYTFKQIDDYLQNRLKYEYPFTVADPKRQKLCCWFEVPQNVLLAAYGKGGMYIHKDITSGRGFGLFTVARLDYVEKLQNYDWLVVDVNIFDAIPGIRDKDFTRDRQRLEYLFRELTRLTQEHYILGYPYPLVEVHNFVSLKQDFKDEIINRVKLSLYRDQQMDHIEIENLFLDIHDRF